MAIYPDNKVQLIGKLGHDAAVRFIQSGQQVTEFSLAVFRGKEKPPLWVKVTIWGEIQDAIARQLLKGARVTILGRLELPETWTSKASGEKNFTQVVVAEEVSITPWEGGSNGEQGARSQSQQQAKTTNSSADGDRSIDDYDDVPF